MTDDYFYNMLSGKIWDNVNFQEDYAYLMTSVLSVELDDYATNKIPISSEKLHKLLQSAAYLAESNISTYQSAAYNIAVYSMYLRSEILDNITTYVYYILGRLGNFPAITLLSNERIFFDSLPLQQQLAFLGHRDNNTKNGICLSDFQSKIWESLENNNSVSVSAPTSAGKSYVFINYIKSFIDKQKSKILYLVPTKALISQVQNDLVGIFSSDVESNISIYTIPIEPKDNKKSYIYVLTQERTAIFLENFANDFFDLVLVDEAHQISDSSRGVLLQEVIERLMQKNHNTKFIFGSPFAKNPDFFKEYFNVNINSFFEENPSVAQNIIDLEYSGKKIKISLNEKNEVYPLGDFFVKKGTCAYDVYAQCCSSLGRKKKNIVFVGSPSYCEKVARRILYYLKPSKTKNVELIKIAKFIRENIHEKYELAEFLEYGIAFHYSQLPTLLRFILEEAFCNIDELQFMVCTSTLLQGVNLPAQNIFIYKPSQGGQWLSKDAKPMSSPSFWNLSGRAGRLTKDFHGNIYLLDRYKWDKNPLQEEKVQTIFSGYHHLLISKYDDVIKSLKEKIFSDKFDTSTVVSKLYCDYIDGKLNAVLEKLKDDLSQMQIYELKKCINNININIPDSILKSNISINPFFKQNMYDHICEKIEHKKHMDLIPMSMIEFNGEIDEEHYKKIYRSYVSLFKRFQKYFSLEQKSDNSSNFFATIALQWMSGKSYKQIIESHINYKFEGKEGKKIHYSSVIRNVLKVIEKDIKFKLSQQANCYNSILKYAFNCYGLNDLIKCLPNLSFYLDVGASSLTMINLIEIGFSRTTSGIISRRINLDSLDRESTIKFIKNYDWKDSDFPEISLREINKKTALL